MIKTFKKYNPGNDQTQFEIVFDLKYNENKMLDFANGKDSYVITIVIRGDHGSIIRIRDTITTNHSFLWSSSNEPWDPSPDDVKEIIEYIFTS